MQMTVILRWAVLLSTWDKGVMGTEHGEITSYTTYVGQRLIEPVAESAFGPGQCGFGDLPLATTILPSDTVILCFVKTGVLAWGQVTIWPSSRGDASGPEPSFSNFNMQTNHLTNLLKMQVLFQKIWGWAWDLHFCFRVLLMLLVWGSDFERQRYRWRHFY